MQAGCHIYCTIGPSPPLRQHHPPSLGPLLAGLQPTRPSYNTVGSEDADREYPRLGVADPDQISASARW